MPRLRRRGMTVKDDLMHDQRVELMLGGDSAFASEADRRAGWLAFCRMIPRPEFLKRLWAAEEYGLPGQIETAAIEPAEKAVIR